MSAVSGPLHEGSRANSVCSRDQLRPAPRALLGEFRARRPAGWRVCSLLWANTLVRSHGPLFRCLWRAAAARSAITPLVSRCSRVESTAVASALAILSVSRSTSNREMSSRHLVLERTSLDGCPGSAWMWGRKSLMVDSCTTLSDTFDLCSSGHVTFRSRSIV